MFMDMLLMPLLVIVKSSVEAAEKAQWFECKITKLEFL